jgi:hypothetical protein
VLLVIIGGAIYSLGEIRARGAMTSPLLSAAAQSLRAFYTGYKKIHERQQLCNRPWEEDLLHFAADGQLHGRIPPPDDGRRHSVTSDGWCTGLSHERPHPGLPSP